VPGPSGAWLTVAAVLLPLGGALVSFLAPRLARGTTTLVAVAVVANVTWLAAVLGADGPLRYHIGGWGAPLGIDLHADGLTLFMLLITALTGAAVSIYGIFYFRGESGHGAGFWPLWLLLWAALNALYLSGDVFNLYVTLELMSLGAVALVALAGSPDALAGAMRYLVASMFASLTYLLGVGLLYHLGGTLDIALLGGTLESSPPTWIALGLMITALLVKSALFPLHFWLPAAHSSAPVPVSALLSGLVVKATIYLLVRLWLEVMPDGKAALGGVLAGLGAGAILWGSLQALRQVELKLLVAYSTVAQLGYLFVPFGIGTAQLAAVAWRGAFYFALCHALAKAAMFMAVGNFTSGGGSGRLEDLQHTAGRRPMSLAAFGVAGITLIGLPPSGGFIGKWMLVEASLGAQQWWLAAVVLAGGLLSAGYVFKVVGLAFVGADEASQRRDAPAGMEWIALVLALATLVLGFTAPPLLTILEVGAPFDTWNAAGTMDEVPR
jgi:formate hydrogenlyase subunit 3/multisubunit Na+/H+ antiporter MnhD subunit